jgi:hypothetical protein
MDFKNLKKKIPEPKVSRLLPNICDFHKENDTQDYRFKNPRLWRSRNTFPLLELAQLTGEKSRP